MNIICTITLDVVDQPFITDIGHTYSKTAILEHLNHRYTDPNTNLPITSVRPNTTLYALKQLTEDELELKQLVLTCPLTCKPLKNPWCYVNGYSYDESAKSMIIAADVDMVYMEHGPIITWVTNLAIKDYMQDSTLEKTLELHPLTEATKFIENKKIIIHLENADTNTVTKYNEFLARLLKIFWFRSDRLFFTNDPMIRSFKTNVDGLSIVKGLEKCFQTVIDTDIVTLNYYIENYHQIFAMQIADIVYNHYNIQEIQLRGWSFILTHPEGVNVLEAFLAIAGITFNQEMGRLEINITPTELLGFYYFEEPFIRMVASIPSPPTHIKYLLIELHCRLTGKNTDLFITTL